MLHHQVLVLNASYEPINICIVKRAIKLLVKGTAVCEETNSAFVTSPSVSLPVPEVIRLKDYIKLPRDRKVFSKRHIFIRDQYTCQYCGRKFKQCELTVDHVVPKSRKGKFVWSNIVTCCRACNKRKGDQTPEEAGMQLMKKPSYPSFHLYLLKMKMAGQGKVNWQKYLFN